ncbi:hypothetical protein CUMW_263020, partial [Citrus unshiu]
LGDAEEVYFVLWFSAQEDEDDGHPNLMWRTTIANGP